MVSADTSPIYVRRYDLVDVSQRLDMAVWAHDHLGFDGSWWMDGNSFYFRKQVDYLWFVLRWN